MSKSPSQPPPQLPPQHNAAQVLHDYETGRIRQYGTLSPEQLIKIEAVRGATRFYATLSQNVRATETTAREMGDSIISLAVRLERFMG